MVILVQLVSHNMLVMLLVMLFLWDFQMLAINFPLGKLTTFLSFTLFDSLLIPLVTALVLLNLLKLPVMSTCQCLVKLLRLTRFVIRFDPFSVRLILLGP
jgi:hypothetical protein